MSSVTDGNWLIFNSEFSHLYPGSLTGLPFYEGSSIVL